VIRKSETIGGSTSAGRVCGFTNQALNSVELSCELVRCGWLATQELERLWIAERLWFRGCRKGGLLLSAACGGASCWRKSRGGRKAVGLRWSVWCWRQGSRWLIRRRRCPQGEAEQGEDLITAG